MPEQSPASKPPTWKKDGTEQTLVGIVTLIEAVWSVDEWCCPTFVLRNSSSSVTTSGGKVQRQKEETAPTQHCLQCLHSEGRQCKGRNRFGIDLRLVPDAESKNNTSGL